MQGKDSYFSLKHCKFVSIFLFFHVLSQLLMTEPKQIPSLFRLLQGSLKEFSHEKTSGKFQRFSYYVRERIRTPDTLVRSQVLYPAELRTHINLDYYKPYCKKVKHYFLLSAQCLSTPLKFENTSSSVGMGFRTKLENTSLSAQCRRPESNRYDVATTGF